jgi:hypothetical protein
MSAWSIALRLMLCVLLVLNAAAPAWAGARVHAGQPAELASAAKLPPCHSSSAMPAADASPALEPGSQEDPSDPATAASDCCNGEACGCACVHHAPAAMVALVSPGLAMRSPLRIGRAHAGHAPPPAPVLIRPPIG